MQIEQFDAVTDTAEIGICHGIYAAGAPLDDPDGPAFSLQEFTGWFSVGWTACPRQAWLAREEDGTAVGFYLLELPDKENRQRAGFSTGVRPDRRRAGLGTALLRHAAQQAAAAGRTLLAGECRDHSPGVGFAAAVGGKMAMIEARRVQELSALKPDRLAELRAEADAKAGGYSLIRWTGTVPEEHLAGVASVWNAMADAPHTEGYEAEMSDAARVREDDHRIVVQGVRAYTVAAREDATGELAALTTVVVDPPTPEWGNQEITAVARPHRGHRLGLLVKLEMLDWLNQAEPKLQRIITGNAAANDHMIGINEDLGYRQVGHWEDWEIGVAQVLEGVPAQAG